MAVEKIEALRIHWTSGSYSPSWTAVQDISGRVKVWPEGDGSFTAYRVQDWPTIKTAAALGKSVSCEVVQKPKVVSERYTMTLSEYAREAKLTALAFLALFVNLVNALTIEGSSQDKKGKTKAPARKKVLMQVESVLQKSLWPARAGSLGKDDPSRILEAAKVNPELLEAAGGLDAQVPPGWRFLDCQEALSVAKGTHTPVKGPFGWVAKPTAESAAAATERKRQQRFRDRAEGVLTAEQIDAEVKRLSEEGFFGEDADDSAIDDAISEFIETMDEPDGASDPVVVTLPTTPASTTAQAAKVESSAAVAEETEEDEEAELDDDEPGEDEELDDDEPGEDEEFFEEEEVQGTGESTRHTAGRADLPLSAFQEDAAKFLAALCGGKINQQSLIELSKKNEFAAGWAAAVLFSVRSGGGLDARLENLVRGRFISFLSEKQG